MPEPVAADTPHGAFEVRYRREAGALSVAEGHVTFKTARVAAAEYPALPRARRPDRPRLCAKGPYRPAVRRGGLSMIVHVPRRRAAAALLVLALGCAAPRAARALAAAPPAVPARRRRSSSGTTSRPPRRASRALDAGGRIRRAHLGAALLARRALDAAAEVRHLLAAAAAPQDPIALVALRRLSELAEESADRAVEIDAGLAPLADGGRLAGLAAHRARIARVTAAEVRGDHAPGPRSAARMAP